MVIKNKATCLFLIALIILFIIGIYMILNRDIENGAIAIICEFLCLYFFIKFNIKSNYLNPNHPTKDEIKS